MTGVFIVLISVAVICWLIVKKFYPAWSLFVVGIVTIAIVAAISGDPVATGKKATGFIGFDILGIFGGLLQSRAGGLGMNIMIIGGFGYYMNKIGATSALVHVCTRPMSLINSPYIIMVLGYVVGQCLNVVLGSAVGLAILMMVTVYPLMLSAGVSRQAACASVVMTGGFGISPLGANNMVASKLTGIHVMNIFVDYQLVIAPVTLIIVCIVHYFVQQYLDKKDLASGRITQADFIAKDLSDADKSEKHRAFMQYSHWCRWFFCLFFLRWSTKASSLTSSMPSWLQWLSLLSLTAPFAGISKRLLPTLKPSSKAWERSFPQPSF